MAFTYSAIFNLNFYKKPLRRQRLFKKHSNARLPAGEPVRQTLLQRRSNHGKLSFTRINPVLKSFL